MDEKKRKARNDVLNKMELEQFAAERKEAEMAPDLKSEIAMEKISDLLSMSIDEEASGRLEDVLNDILKQICTQNINASYVFLETAHLLRWIRAFLIIIILILLFK